MGGRRVQRTRGNMHTWRQQLLLQGDIYGTNGRVRGMPFGRRQCGGGLRLPAVRGLHDRLGLSRRPWLLLGHIRRFVLLV